MGYLPDGMPLPAIETDSAGFWEAAKRHELVAQRCTDCGAFRHPPMPVCYNCQSLNFEWAKVSGKGKVWNRIIAHHPVHPALRDREPYNVVLVDLDDAPGVRMVGNLIDCPNEEVKVGMPVKVCFEDKTEDITLPQWQRDDKA